MIKKVWFCKILPVILFLIFAVSLITAQNNTHSGLLLSEQFKSRLNLSVDNKYSVKDSLQISFDISLDTEKYWGNIFFLGDENDFYINLSLITYRSEDSSYIVLFINQQESTISFVDLKEDLDLLSWEHFDIKLNLINNKISVTYKNITKDIRVDLPDDLELDIIFGGVPPFHYLAGLDACYFAVRNIKLSIDKKREHLWELDEVKGDYAYDEIGFNRGKQEHSEWLQNYHTGWKEIIRFDSDYMPGITFNEKESEIVVVNQEYMTKFNIISREKEEIEFRKKRPRTANTAIFNNVTNKLLSYYHGTGQISEFEEESKTWSSIDISKDTMQHYYVHTNFVDSGNGYVYILGGYGWFILKNDLQKYDFNNKIWQKINITGDFYKPRSNPLISSGRNKGEFYVFGGMGNKSGRQEEGYKPIKDLHLLNLNENTFTKLWENNDSAVALPVTNRSGNLVADYDKNVLYAVLINDHRDADILSSSKLCEISIDSGYIKEISNPISDEDKLWNMHLFFCKYSNSFILAAGKLTDGTKVKGEVIIYSLMYPPLSNEQLIENQKKKEVRYAKNLPGNTLSYIIAGLTIVFFSFFILRYKRGRKKVSLQIKDNKSTLHISDDKNRITNSINILGNFLMIDKDGKDITNLFNPKLKELFLFIFLKSYTNNGNYGINSKQINMNFWPDAMPNEAKNVRGVSLHNLKELLKNFEMIELLYKGKNWFLEISSAVNFDYLQYLSLSEKINNNEFNSDYLKIYINTVKKGGLLPTDSYKWLDGIKYEINEKIIIDTQKIIENIDIDKDSQIIIELCDIIFSIDPVYESALISKIRALSSIGHFGAMKKTYEQFYEEYKVLYDEKYPLSFDEIVKKAK